MSDDIKNTAEYLDIKTENLRLIQLTNDFEMICEINPEELADESKQLISVTLPFKLKHEKYYDQNGDISVHSYFTDYNVFCDNGKVEVKALNGQTLTVIQKDGKIWLKDQNGNYSEIVATDVNASNGVIHVIDTVVMPK